MLYAGKKVGVEDNGEALGSSKPALKLALKLRLYAMEVLVLVGKLAETVRDGSNSALIDGPRLHILEEITTNILRMGFELSLDICEVVKRKMKNNSMKYPVEECVKDGSIRKYTEHSAKTGIKDDTCLSVLDGRCEIASVGFECYENEFTSGIAELKSIVYDFAESRGWLDKYTVANTLFALGSEIGELMELFHWYPIKEDVVFVIDRERLAGEIADVLIYCLHFMRVEDNATKS